MAAAAGHQIMMDQRIQLEMAEVAGVHQAAHKALTAEAAAAADTAEVEPELGLLAKVIMALSAYGLGIQAVVAVQVAPVLLIQQMGG